MPQKRLRAIFNLAPLRQFQQEKCLMCQPEALSDEAFYRTAAPVGSLAVVNVGGKAEVKKPPRTIWLTVKIHLIN